MWLNFSNLQRTSYIRALCMMLVSLAAVGYVHTFICCGADAASVYVLPPIYCKCD